MKIIFAIKALENIQGGAERVLAEVANNLSKLGYNIIILSFDRAGSKSFYPLNPDIERVYLEVGNPHKKTTLPIALKRVKELRALIKDKKPDIVIPFMHSMFIPMAFAASGTGVPTLASEHIVPAHYKNHPIQYLAVLASFFLVKNITVLSGNVKKLYPAIFHSKMVPVANPVFRVQKKADPIGENKKRKTILNIGRLSDQKDQATLIRAFANLSTQYHDWDLEIYGAGELQNKLANLIKGFNLENRVFLKGTTDNISAVYAQAQIFALSSKYESFGLATAEAMAHGLPCIGFADCPGTNELIQHDKTGLLVPSSHRIENFAYALETLITDAEARERMGKEGAQIVEQFSEENITKQWVDIIQTTVNSGFKA